MQNAEKTILAVDDDQDILEMLTMLLRSEDYRVLVAPGGHEAIELLRSERPDLVLLDIMMPSVSGHEVHHFIRSEPELADTRVVMLTAKNEIDDIALALDEGADGFIVKPFDVDHFLRVVGFRVAGKQAEFYRRDNPIEGFGRQMKRSDLSDKSRIVFLDFFEPEAELSAVVGATETRNQSLMSLWQEESEEDLLHTTALIHTESSTHFGELLNSLLEASGVQIEHCLIFRNFDEIPADIMGTGIGG